jgi:TPR repeat protein
MDNKIILQDFIINNNHNYDGYEKVNNIISLWINIIDQHFCQTVRDYVQPLAYNNNSNAQVILGDLYYYGIIVKDFTESVKWYKLSAAQNNSYGQYKLACSYMYGYGIEKNWYRAVEYCELAAKQNNIHALKKLGDLLLEGDIDYSQQRTIKSIEFARPLKYYTIACNGGHKDAIFSLKALYASNQFIPTMTKLYNEIDELKQKNEKQEQHINHMLKN